MRRSQRRSRGFVVLVILLAAAALHILYLYATLTLPRGEERQPVRIYGAPYPLVPGLKLDKTAFHRRLNHLGYRSVNRNPRRPGEYHQAGSSWDVYLRSFVYPEGTVKARLLRLVVDDEQISRVLELPDEQEAEPAALEPQLVGGLLATSRQVREWIPFAAMPPQLIDAVLAIEDHRFYDHVGIDLLAVMRAAWENLTHGAVLQGGSTITQQLAKNLYYTRHRTFLRKLQEAVAALILEWKYTKQQILESYLNEVYLGQSGSVAIYGIGEAAHHYFGKSLADLTIAESALLAGMIKGPNTYAPVKNSARAKKRRDLVLLRLKQEGKLSDKHFQVATSTPIRAAGLQQGLSDAPYFVDYVLSQSEDSAHGPLPAGVRLFTTLDAEMQRLAEEVVRRGLLRLERRHRSLASQEKQLQAALVVLDPKSGAIRALVGGRDYRTSQFNHAVQAKRQAGSLLKPFIYLAAFERRADPQGQGITAATLLDDSPITFANADTPWSPQNYDRQFHGLVTVRTAVEQSLNIPAVRVAQTVGIPRIIEILREVGIKGPLDEHLSLALGSSEVSLLEMTGAYAALAAAGHFTPPHGLQAVAGEQMGEIFSRETAAVTEVFSPQAAYLVTSLLRGAVERGTASPAKAMGLTVPAAGKTGTTDDHRDAWFLGYTPDLVVGVWVGFDDATPLRLSGAQAALPIWVDFVQQTAPIASGEFAVPPGIVTRMIDPQTAQLATSYCPEAREEIFLEGTEPTVFCQVHSPGFLDKLRHIFGVE